MSLKDLRESILRSTKSISEIDYSELEKFKTLARSLVKFKSAWKEAKDAWLDLDDEDQILADEYPFNSSFNELYQDVNRWVSRVLNKVADIDRTTNFEEKLVMSEQGKQNDYLVNIYDQSGQFIQFKTFDSNSKAIEYADKAEKFKIFKATSNGVFEIESFGFR